MNRPLNDGERDIVRAQNDALLALPQEADAARALIFDVRKRRKDMNDRIAQVKREAGLTTALTALTDVRKLTPQAIKMLDILSDMGPEPRARTVRQVVYFAELLNFVYPDLFDHGAVGVGSNDAEGETAGFDKTGEGKRRGSGKAQPSAAAQPAAGAQAQPTPGIPLDEALRRFEEEKAKAEGKRGPKPKALKEAEAVYNAAKAAAESAPAEEVPVAEAAAEPEHEPTGEEPRGDNVVSISRQMREANKSGDQHIRDVAAKLAAEQKEKEAGTSTSAGAPPPPVEEPAPKTKASRKGKAGKEKPMGVAEAAAASAGAPPPPPSEDDSEADEDDFRSAPVGGDAGGQRSPSFSVR